METRFVKGRVFLTPAGIDFVAARLRKLYIYGDRLTEGMLRGWVEDVEARIDAGEGATLDIGASVTTTGLLEVVEIPAEFLEFRN